MASPVTNNPQAMTAEAMKHTVLTGPAILAKFSTTEKDRIMVILLDLSSLSCDTEEIYEPAHGTEVRFARFLSGGFTKYYGSNRFTGKETGQTHL